PQGFAVQVLAGTGVVDMRSDPRQRGAQDLQALDEGVACGIPDAVVQVGARRPFRVVLQRFEPGQERRDSDAARDPGLAGRAAPVVEAAVGAFDLYGLARAQALSQSAGVVAQGLDLEAQA